MRIFTGRLRSNGAAHADARERYHFGVLPARTGGCERLESAKRWRSEQYNNMANSPYP